MGRLHTRLLHPDTPFFSHSSFADIIYLRNAQVIDIDWLAFPCKVGMGDTEHNWQADRELCLSSPSATVFLRFMLNDGGGYLDTAVAERIEAIREALSNIGVSWEELLQALRQERWDTEAER